MPSYLVRWEIELDADNEREAAIEAREIQLDSDNIATHFEVFNLEESFYEDSPIEIFIEDDGGLLQ